MKTPSASRLTRHVAAVTTALATIFAPCTAAGAFEAFSSGSAAGDYKPSPTPPPANSGVNEDVINTPQIQGGESYLENRAPGLQEALPNQSKPQNKTLSLQIPDNAIKLEKDAISGDSSLPGGGTVDKQYVPEPRYKTEADRVYRYTKGFEFLKSPGELVPGGQILIDKNNGTFSCSLGYLAKFQGYLVGVTAGHCGAPGDFVYVRSRYGRKRVGTFVYSNWNRRANANSVRVTSPDLGLFVITNRNIPLQASPFTTPLGPMLTPYKAWQMISTRPSKYVVCSVGHKTGMTCGRFGGWDKEVYGVFAHRTGTIPGDSGGAVMLWDGQTMYPLGVTSVGHDTWGNDYAVGQELADYGIQVYRR